MAAERNLVSGTTISRLMGPNEANVNGNVHGGHILNMIDEAGIIISSRYCNNAENRDPSTTDCVTELARIEHMDFLLPMHIGEVAELHAEIIYTSDHSLEVFVTVWAENVIKGGKRLTNKARLWYVSKAIQDPDGSSLLIPRMTYPNKDLETKGSRACLRHQQSVKEEQDKGMLQRPLNIFSHNVADPELFTVQYSTTCLSVLIGRNDVTFHSQCRGGVILKLMDECAGITARKHCQCLTVTAGIEATNFHNKIPLGSLVNVYGWVNFTSNRSMEIEVVVEVVKPYQRASENERAVDALFTFVAIDKDDKAQPIPPLKVETEDEKLRFEEGRQRYQKRKQKRASLKHH